MPLICRDAVVCDLEFALGVMVSQQGVGNLLRPRPFAPLHMVLRITRPPEFLREFSGRVGDLHLLPVSQRRRGAIDDVRNVPRLANRVGISKNRSRVHLEGRAHRFLSTEQTAIRCTCAQ